MRRVRILLETRFDYLPQLRIGELHGAVQGPAESRKVPCDTCKETGRVTRGPWVTRCGDCDGTGLRRRRKDDPAWDEYVEANVAEIRAEDTRTISGGFNLGEDIKRLDRELHKLRVDEYARAGIVADEEAWVRRLDAQESHGSYAELRHGLRRLEGLCPRLRWAVRVVYELAVEADAPLARVLEPLAVAALARFMRGPINIPTEYQEFYAEQKRASITDLLRLGWKVNRIARELGVPEQKVKHVKRRLA